MWLQRKAGVLFLLSGLWLLAGCGFHPMYGQTATEAGANSALQGNVIIAPIGKGHLEQILKNALEDRFNPEGVGNANPDYTLKITLKRVLTPSVVRNDGTILRYDVRFYTDYSLIDNATKKQVTNGNLRRISSYNVVSNGNFATYEAEQDLDERMLNEIAEDYVLRISGFLAGKKPSADKPS